MARTRRVVAYHREYDWFVDNASDSEVAWSRGIATVRATGSAREGVKEDGEEDPGCPVYRRVERRVELIIGRSAG